MWNPQAQPEKTVQDFLHHGHANDVLLDLD